MRGGNVEIVLVVYPLGGRGVKNKNSATRVFGSSLICTSYGLGMVTSEIRMVDSVLDDLWILF